MVSHKELAGAALGLGDATTLRTGGQLVTLARDGGFHFLSGGENLCLLDYVSNNVLRIYNHDLMFNDKKLVRLYLRHLGGHKLKESVQFDIGRCFFADLYLWIAWHLRNMRVVSTISLMM